MSTLSEKMKLALKALYESPKCVAYIHISTFNALNKRGFVCAIGGYSACARAFRSERAQLTEKGYCFCKHQLQ